MADPNQLDGDEMNEPLQSDPVKSRVMPPWLQTTLLAMLTASVIPVVGALVNGHSRMALAEQAITVQTERNATLDERFDRLEKVVGETSADIRVIRANQTHIEEGVRELKQLQLRQHE